MGIGIVLLFWITAGVVFTAIGTGIATSEASELCYGISNPKQKKRITREVTLFPIGLFAWLIVVFVFQAAVNICCLQRDCGIGDGFGCPLPNGYALSGIDDVAYMRLYNPQTVPEGSDGLINNRPDAVRNVISLQVAKSYMAGASAENRISAGSDNLAGDSYFILDIRSGTQEKYTSIQELQTAAMKRGFKLQLQPIDEIYYQNRYTVFDRFVTFLQLGAPALYFYGVSRRARRFRLEELAQSFKEKR